MIIFSEKEHTYVHKESGNKLNGWTSLIKNYTEPFDSETQKITSAYSMYIGQEYVKLKFGRYKDYSLKDFVDFLNENYPGLPKNFVNEISYEWEYAAILGSEFHNKLEEDSYKLGYEVNPFTDKKYKTIVYKKDYDNQSLLPNLFDLEDGYYPELLVWDFSMGEERTPVTMIDKCFIETIDGVRYIDVDDIKTNKSIWSGKDKFMKGPLSSLYDNTEDKYKLQACFGAKLMETFGYVPRYCGFTHFKEYNKNKNKLYIAKYNKELMENFQKDWKRLYSKIDEYK